MQDSLLEHARMNCERFLVLCAYIVAERSSTGFSGALQRSRRLVAWSTLLEDMVLIAHDAHGEGDIHESRRFYGLGTEEG